MISGPQPQQRATAAHRVGSLSARGGGVSQMRRRTALARHTLIISWRIWSGLRPVGTAHIVEYGLALLIDKAGEQLLRIPGRIRSAYRMPFKWSTT
jgi:hypothetical protein